jgi:MOSC domain-containing protein YiiM
MGRLLSVNVGRPRPVGVRRGRPVQSAIGKAPVDGRVRVEGVNLAGDDQADRRVHGGPDKAVYAYAEEDYAWWSEALGRPVEAASFGENLTTRGIDLRAARIGDRWRVGTALLEVAQPREPCFKLGIRMGDDLFPGRFEVAGRPGAYLRIVEEGEIAAGDAIEVEPTTLRAITVGSLVSGDLTVELLRQIAADERVPDGWRTSAQRALAREG